MIIEKVEKEREKYEEQNNNRKRRIKGKKNMKNKITIEKEVITENKVKRKRIFLKYSKTRNK